MPACYIKNSLWDFNYTVNLQKLTLANILYNINYEYFEPGVGIVICVFFCSYRNDRKKNKYEIKYYLK